MIRKIGAMCLCVMLFMAPQAAQAEKFLPFLSFAAGLLNKGVFPKSDKYTTDDDIVVTADDGVELEGNIFVPNNLGGLAPVVIFVNSWALNEYEYLAQAADLAEKGYIVFSYSTRGFGQSGGFIDVAGPSDVSDLSKIIDFLIENYPVDPNAIGSAGVSYGAGISLLGAAHDPRIKAVAALSSWADLEASLYGNNTPRLVWGEFLTRSAQITGNPRPELAEFWQILRSQDLEQKDRVVNWALPRSPLTHVDKINANGTAIYFSQNYGDNMFQPNSVLNFYSKLATPKYITLQPGTHASAEFVPPLTGVGDNYIFEDMYRWFDIHLKGEENALSYAQPVNMKVKFRKYFQSFTEYPVAEAKKDVFYMHPRRPFDIGDLETYPYSRRNYDNTIYAWTGTLFTTAIPILSSTLEQLEVPVKAPIPLISPVRSIYFRTAKLDETMKIRGVPNVKLQLETRSEEVQVVAYLYDMNSSGVGTLITHGVYTIPRATPGERVTLDIDLVATAYDVPEGHRLAIAFDTRDLLYKNPASSPYFLDFEFSKDKQSVLTVPRL